MIFAICRPPAAVRWLLSEQPKSGCQLLLKEISITPKTQLLCSGSARTSTKYAFCIIFLRLFMCNSALLNLYFFAKQVSPPIFRFAFFHTSILRQQFKKRRSAARLRKSSKGFAKILFRGKEAIRRWARSARGCPPLLGIVRPWPPIITVLACRRPQARP